MANLSSNSSNSDVLAAYYDACAYDVDNDAAMCRAFIEAARQLLVRRPQRVNHQGEEVQIDQQQVADQLQRATEWLAAQTAASAGGYGVRLASFADGRQ